MEKTGSLARLSRFLIRLETVFREKGIRKGINYFFKDILGYIDFYIYKFTNSSKSFNFQGKNYEYFIHHYNRTWRTERSVEISIIMEMIKKYKGKKILEVGNVLSHYFNVDHEIIDKYETDEGVINLDIVDFKTSKKYDLILSISTIEHIGWSYKKRDENKILNVIKKLKDLLSSNGEIILSFPVGWNPILDNNIKEGLINFRNLYCFRRISPKNDWINTNWENIQEAKLNYPYPGVNALAIGIIGK